MNGNDNILGPLFGVGIAGLKAKSDEIYFSEGEGAMGDWFSTQRTNV